MERAAPVIVHGAGSLILSRRCEIVKKSLAHRSLAHCQHNCISEIQTKGPEPRGVIMGLSLRAHAPMDILKPIDFPHVSPEQSAQLSPLIGFQFSAGALRLFAWHEVNNFGDRLGPALFQQISQRYVYVEARGMRPTFDGPAREIHCFLGTLAHLLQGPHHFVMWGFGTAPAEGPAHHGCAPIAEGLDLEVRALRGPLTRNLLVDAGYAVSDQIPYGDPGLLIPAFYKPSPLKVDDFCIVPHHSDYETWRWKFPGMNVINIKTPSYASLPGLIQEITKYRAIFTSSLHVTILAESFGIPVQPIAPKLPFKFDDFYAAVGKSMKYLPLPSGKVEWPLLVESAIQKWRPIRWNPELWLAAAPFPLRKAPMEALCRHYRDLVKRKHRTYWLERAFNRKLRKYYAPLNAPSEPPDTQPQYQWGNSKVLKSEDWFPSDSPAPIFERSDRAIALNGIATPLHAATRFFSIGPAAEILFRVPVTSIAGNIKILIQNESYVIRASATILENDLAGIREIPVIPVHPPESLRLCILILSGKVTVGEVEILHRKLEQPHAGAQGRKEGKRNAVPQQFTAASRQL